MNVGGRLFFTANDGIHGAELWRSDGTAAGTALVKDLIPGEHPEYPDLRDLTAVGGTLFFTVDDGVHGRELWKSDGTAAGTVLVKDIYPNDDQYVGGPTYLTAVGSTLFFTARDGIHGRELWKSDGTRAGTVMVKDITPGNSYYYGYPHRPGSYRHHSLTAVGGTLFFTARDDIHGQELWKSDGTTTGTALVRDIYPGIGGAGYYGPDSLADVGGTLFFAADDGSHGTTLWKSDGTKSGTVLVKQGSGGYPRYVTDVGGGRAFFAAEDVVHGHELWKTDGTRAGTVLVKNIRPGSSSSYPRALTAVGRRVFFTADDGNHGVELWRSTGTKAGTVLVKNLMPGDYASDPSYLTARTPVVSATPIE